MKGSIEGEKIQGSEEEWDSLTTSSVIKGVQHLYYKGGRAAEWGKQGNWNFNITRAEGVTTSSNYGQRWEKKTGRAAQIGEVRIWEAHRDTPTTSISHAWRGSALKAKRAGREDGKVEKVEE